MSVTVGREEWVGLPDIGIPAIRAKVDTGAQTSSLHAFAIHRIDGRGEPRVRFGVHPLPEQPDVELLCEAPLIGERPITSSNGETELRYVINATLSVGGRQWPIEISLTNRERMTFRMLLGRQALEAGVLVDVTRACLHGEPDLSVYEALRHSPHAARSLSVALLSASAESATSMRLVETGAARGHAVVPIELSRCALTVTGGRATILLDGAPLPRFDCAIALSQGSPSRQTLALLRRMELDGSRAVNGSAALAIAADPTRMIEHLVQRGLPIPKTALAPAGDAETIIEAIGGPPVYLRRLGERRIGPRKFIADSGELLAVTRGGNGNLLLQHVEPGHGLRRCLVIGRRVVAATGRPSQPPAAVRRKPRKGRPTKDERSLARRAARTLGLQAAVVDLVTGPSGPLVLDVAPLQDLERFEDAAGLDAAALLFLHLERLSGRGDTARNKTTAGGTKLS